MQNHHSIAVQRNALQAIADLGQTETELVGKEESARKFNTTATGEENNNCGRRLVKMVTIMN